jgi:hypothetical protein
MRGFMAFAVCFTFLTWIWYEHCLFFRRYGLQDALTVFLNAVLLFLILFYIYPLKFLFTALFNEVPFFNAGGPSLDYSRPEQIQSLMIIYSIGFLLIFLTFLLLHLRAYRKRQDLELDEAELVQTIGRIRANSISIGIALLSIALSVFGGQRMSGLAGMIYGLMGPAYGLNGYFVGRRLTEVLNRERSPTSPFPTRGRRSRN